MLHTPLTKQALLFAWQAHQGQTDHGGLPYIFHPFHLAEQMPDEYSTAAALLHDVVEDTACTLEDLASAGFPQPVLEAVALLTHDPAVPYLEYVRRIADAGNPIARRVKLADLHHNSDPGRLDSITPEDEALFERYRQALELLGESPL